MEATDICNKLEITQNSQIITQSQTHVTPEKSDIDKTLNKELTIDDAYEYMGKCGKYQTFATFAAGLSYMAGMLYLFSMPMFSLEPQLSKCWINGNLTSCDLIEDKCVSNVTYEYTDKQYNFITEYDLLCDSLAVSMIPSASTIGSACGIAVFGILADAIGRLPILAISNGSIILCLLIIVFTSNYNVTLYLSVIAGFFQAGAMTAPYTFAYESVTVQTASYYGSAVIASYGLGTIIVPLHQKLRFSIGRKTPILDRLFIF